MQEAPGRHDTRKIVTVLFCDLVDSTAMGEGLDPETTRGIISRYFEVVRAALERHGGTVEKFIGDAVMAVFGIPELHEDDTLRAVRAAADIGVALASLNQDSAAFGRPALAVRIGIDTGPAAMGSGIADQQLVTGPAVNRAARIEASAAPGEVLLGPDTVALLRGAVDAEPLAPRELKGIGGAVELWRLIAVLPDAQAIGRRADTPFVGRSVEAGVMRTAFDAVVAEQACGLVTVVGPAGIGKSRLGGELARLLAGRAEVLTGRCLPYGEGITYAAFGEIVAQAGVPLSEILDGSGDAPLIESLVTRALAETDDAGSPDEAAWAFRRVLEALARRRPLVVVIDDLHWAQPTLIDLLDYVLAFSQGVPILLVCLTRQELFDTRPSWAAPRPDATLVRLDPLSEVETRRLVDGLMDLPGFDPSLRDRIVARAAGNPLFVEQLLAMLADRADAGAAGDLPVPPTIRALLAARVDRLPDSERAVAQAASIEGWVFRRSVVAALLEAPARDRLAGHLMSLVRKEIIQPDRTTTGSEDTFRFNHALVRDAAYEALSKSARAELHERYAGWLEETAAHPDDVAEAAAHHLEMACGYRRELGAPAAETNELAVRAGRALGQAGRRMNVRGDAAAATDLLTRALVLLQSSPATRLDLVPDLGLAMRENGDLAGAALLLADGATEARTLGDERTELRSDIEGWRVDALLDGSDAEGALATAHRAIELFEGLGDEAGLSAAWFLRAMYATAWVDRVEAFERARQHATAARDDRRMVDIWNEFGGAMLFGPTPYAEVMAFIDEEMGWARDKGYPGVEADAALVGPYCYPLFGRWDEARALLARSKALASELGIRYGLAEACWAGAQMEMLAGDLEAAEREMRASLAIHEEIGTTRYQAMVRAHLAHVLLDQDRVADAVAMIGSALALGASNGPRFEAYWRTARARALVRNGGDAREAVRLARDGVEIVARTDRLNLQAETFAVLAEVLDATGDRASAIAALDDAARLYARKGNPLLVERTREARTALTGGLAPGS